MCTEVAHGCIRDVLCPLIDVPSHRMRRCRLVTLIPGFGLLRSASSSCQWSGCACRRVCCDGRGRKSQSTLQIPGLLSRARSLSVRVPRVWFRAPFYKGLCRQMMQVLSVCPLLNDVCVLEECGSARACYKTCVPMCVGRRTSRMTDALPRNQDAPLLRAIAPESISMLNAPPETQAEARVTKTESKDDLRALQYKADSCATLFQDEKGARRATARGLYSRPCRTAIDGRPDSAVRGC